MKWRCKLFIILAVLFLAVPFSKNLLAGQDRVSKPSFKPSNQQSEIQNPKLNKTEVMQKTKKLQMPFIANNGQTDERVKFYAKTFGGSVFVMKDGEIVYSLPRVEEKTRNCEILNPCCGDLQVFNPFFSKERSLTTLLNKEVFINTTYRAITTGVGKEKKTRGVVLKEEMVGGKANEIKGEEKATTQVSYFKGKDPSKWKSSIPTYDVVTLAEVYKGIDLKLKAYGNNVEKLFTVKPGASPDQIKIRLCGANPQEFPLNKGGDRGLVVNEQGELEVETELGTVKYSKPIAYQDINGKRVKVDVGYSIQKSAIKNPKSEYGFKVAAYDKTKDLIIDPLLASTYLGGSSDDYGGNSLALDTSGNVYVTGMTYSADFPTTSGAYDTSFNGYGAVFISKLDSGLTSLLASTYLGGYGNDIGNSLALDTSGNVYVTGITNSSNFPTTSGAYNTSVYSGYDAFISKLDGNLSATTVTPTPTSTPTFTPSPTPTEEPTLIPTPTPSPSPTLVALCEPENMTASPQKMIIEKGSSGSETITVTCEDGSPLEGKTIASVVSKGKKKIAITPESALTDVKGQAVFSIKGLKEGTSKISFICEDLKVKVKVKVTK